MTYSVTKDISTLLVSNSIGTFANDIFIGREPLTPDACVTIYVYGGASPEPAQRLDYPSVQIRVRGALNGYVAAEQKMQSIKNAMISIAKQTINSSVYVGIWQIGDTIFLKYDEKERPIFVSNWKIAVQPAVTDNRTTLG